MRLNRTLHGRSVHRAKDVPGHNVVYGYSRRGTGDGVDLFCAAGTEVYAMHPGAVTRIADRFGKLACVYVQGAGVLTVYAHLHIKPSLNKGDIVRRGQVIGYVGRKLKDPHLHLEVIVGGEPIHGATPRHFVEALATLLD
jgi:murein DD-endopeptidase MepM/ murein hydrolase activator NlpD